MEFGIVIKFARWLNSVVGIGASLEVLTEAVGYGPKLKKRKPKSRRLAEIPFLKLVQPETHMGILRAIEGPLSFSAVLREL